MKTTSMIGIASLILTLTLTSCFSYSSTQRGHPYTTSVSQQTRSTPNTTTTTRSMTY
ncbi:MAG: hypothetical protein WCR44_06030 [Verrucomicrobiota bacterium]|jgi:hypothetical protein